MGQILAWGADLQSSQDIAAPQVGGSQCAASGDAWFGSFARTWNVCFARSSDEDALSGHDTFDQVAIFL